MKAMTVNLTATPRRERADIEIYFILDDAELGKSFNLFDLYFPFIWVVRKTNEKQLRTQLIKPGSVILYSVKALGLSFSKAFIIKRKTRAGGTAQLVERLPKQETSNLITNTTESRYGDVCKMEQEHQKFKVTPSCIENTRLGVYETLPPFPKTKTKQKATRHKNSKL